MRHLPLASLFLLSITAWWSSAQSPSPSPQPRQQDAAKQKPPSGSPGETAGASAGPAATQAPTKPANQSTEDEGKKKAKRVWTNEEIGAVKDGVSVVGEHSGNGGDIGAASSPSQSPSSNSYTPPTNYEILVRRYREKLEPLRGELADLDRKIQLARQAKGNAREDTAAWIAVQERRRQDVLAKIERIEEEAREKGVTPGDLR
jgi:hypothetical protein